jgi:hypothetical protein
MTKTAWSALASAEVSTLNNPHLRLNRDKFGTLQKFVFKKLYTIDGPKDQSPVESLFSLSFTF